MSAPASIRIRGAREHNLKDVSINVPRDKLVVITGVSGSGKSSLAFDTLYAEGQRLYLEALSAHTKKFIEQLPRPKVGAVSGLSPVVSIEQKTITDNPRSTVGTLSEINGYVNVLFAYGSVAACPVCSARTRVRQSSDIAQQVQRLARGARVELYAPILAAGDTDLAAILDELRVKRHDRILVDGEVVDASEWQGLSLRNAPRLEIPAGTLVAGRDSDRETSARLREAVALGESFVRLAVDGAPPSDIGCPSHGIVACDLEPHNFVFNQSAAACRRCGGLGTHLEVDPDRLVQDPSRSVRDGAIWTMTYDRRSAASQLLYSVSQHYGFELDTPFRELTDEARRVLLHGTGGVRVTMLLPPDAEGTPAVQEGVRLGFDGAVGMIERLYRGYREARTTPANFEQWLRRVMVDRTCPDCAGSRFRPSRNLFTVDGATVQDVAAMPLSMLRSFFANLGDGGALVSQVAADAVTRIDTVLDTGLDYLSLDRGSRTLSGGEAQRIRLSTQIGSGLTSMLYVLDEPTIGLHPKDTGRIIATLQRLRDAGNTVIVVEHDLDVIRSADHVVEMGPGPGSDGGNVVAQGSIDDLLRASCATGAFLSGERRIALRASTRAAPAGSLVVRGARENNLKGIDVEIPLHRFVCVTGVSGSGKSSLAHDIVYRGLERLRGRLREGAGSHDWIDGWEQVTDVVNIDQSPIGRSARSNPATYMGLYDTIRKLFAGTDEALARGYTAGRFSFNVQEGRCSECEGDGSVWKRLYFLPDVETLCPACNGARLDDETLQIRYRDASIAEVLGLTVTEALAFFSGQRSIARKLTLLDDLGLSYLQIGQSATTLSGGEAQRIKIAERLAKVVRGHTLYVLDEPTRGWHLADVERLVSCLNRLVDSGSTVLVIEHHLDVIKQADHIIDLGPDAGDRGGELVATGSPQQIAASERSHTGRFLRDVLSPS